MLHVQLPAHVGSVPLARHRVVDYCTGDQCTVVPPLEHRPGVDTTQLVALLTTELVANAVEHGHGDVLDLAVDCSADGIWVGCTDANPAVPVLRDVDLQATSGRGVALIATLASAWGVDAVGSRGKQVWFRVGP